MDAGTQARTVACTNMNATSSRAHTIFQIVLTQTKVDAEAGKATDKVGRVLPVCHVSGLWVWVRVCAYLPVLVVNAVTLRIHRLVVSGGGLDCHHQPD